MDTIDKLRQIYKKQHEVSSSFIERDYYYSYSCGFAYDSLTKDLDPSCCKLILIIMNQLKKTNSSYEQSDYQKIMNRLKVQITSESCGLSRNTLYKSIKTLVDQGVIVKDSNIKGSYVANPFYFNILSKKQYSVFLGILSNRSQPSR